MWLNSGSSGNQRGSTLTRLIYYLFKRLNSWIDYRLIWVNVESNLNSVSWVERNPAAGPDKWVPRWGGGAGLGALTEKGPSAKRTYKAYVKVANCLKKQHNVSQKGPILKLSGAPRSLPPKRWNFWGPGDRSPRDRDWSPRSLPVSPALPCCKDALSLVLPPKHIFLCATT